MSISITVSVVSLQVQEAKSLSKTSHVQEPLSHLTSGLKVCRLAGLELGGAWMLGSFYFMYRLTGVLCLYCKGFPNSTSVRKTAGYYEVAASTLSGAA